MKLRGPAENYLRAAIVKLRVIAHFAQYLFAKKIVASTDKYESMWKNCSSYTRRSILHINAYI